MMNDGIERGAEALDKLASASPKKKQRKNLRVVPASGSFNADGRRVIRHAGGKLSEIVYQVGQALAEHCDNLFSYTGRVVCVHVAAETTSRGVRRPGGALVVHTVAPPYLTVLATRAAIHERFDARTESFKPCDCPFRVAVAYLDQGIWPELPELSGFVEAPLITAEGRIIDRPGYDEPTGLFFCGGEIPGYTTPPAKPTRAAAAHALDTLLDLFAEFPYVTRNDLAATLAGIITALVRRILPAAPLIAITAPTSATGKTLLGETFAGICTGRRASVLSLDSDDTESEKRLVGMLLAGDIVILIDNVERGLNSVLLCQATTQTSVRVRPLGASGMVSIPTHAFICATGNNLQIRRDLKRRTVLIRLDAGQERPEQRTFKHDHLKTVFAKRGSLIRAALTVPLAYLAAGAPEIPNLQAFGGFELWNKLVRRPLVWLGLPDPLKGSETLRESDPDLEGMRSLLGAWAEVFADKPTTAAEVTAAGMSSAMSSEHRNPALYDALQLVCAEKVHPRRLGYWLRSHRDKIVDGMQLKQDARDEHTKAARWKVSKCG